MAKASRCPNTSGGNQNQKCLKECPTNVKEAIDWVICLTNNTGCHCQEKQQKGECDILDSYYVAVDPSECLKKVATDVWNLLITASRSGETSEKWSWNEVDMTKPSDSSSQKGAGETYVKELIECLGEKLSNFLGCIQCKKKQCRKCTSGQCTGGLASDKYNYCYLPTSDCCINSKDTDKKDCAKILLGCIPLIFSSLTYLYWNCCANGNAGKWKNCDLTSGTKDPLCTYLVTLGFDNEQFNKCKGSEVKGFLGCFSELKDCPSGSKPPTLPYKEAKSYAGFVDAFEKMFTTIEQGQEAGGTQEKKREEGKKMPLQRLYMGASFYFQAIQAEQNQKLDKARRPETICELLYWLLGLPYTPMGEEVDTSSLQVLLGEDDDDSEENKGCSYLPSEKCCKSPPPPSECPMTPENADSYLLPPCYYSAFVLLSIQGTLVSGRNTTVERPASTGGNDNKTPGPFLHDVYANLQFQFYYPSSIRSWAAMIWDVVYALYFELGFLYTQCKVEYSTGYGWKDCAYGKDVKCYESKTWICTNIKSSGVQHDQCGKEPNNCSPLQGFLCDKLTDFTCRKKDEESKPESKSESETDSKSYCTHLDHLPPSQWCPIPMGFKDNIENLTSQRKGEHISAILELYFEENTEGSSLYQLVLFVSIVSLRAPRCLGDMFAFFCGIGRLCNTKPDQQDGSLETLWKDKITGYPGTPNLKKVTESLKTLAGSCTHPVLPNDTCHSLCSLNLPDGPQGNCKTKYLCPLSWSVYTVFSTRHIEAYVSWVVYMIDDFKSNLSYFLKCFEEVECNHGCSHCTDKQTCHKANPSGGCQCNMVKCKDILGALYSFGFRYQDAYSLQSSKKCSDFLQQLKAVTYGSSIKALKDAVNQMLYSIRLAFIFWAWLLWTAAIVYLVFGLVVDLDILHIRSHIWLKHTHNIPAFNLFAARRLKYGIQVYFGR